MRQTIFLILIALFGCNKPNWTPAEVEKNCTGSYLKINDKYYLVCNTEKVSGFADGDRVEARVRFGQQCNQEGVVCMVVFPTEGYLKIEKIRKR